MQKIEPGQVWKDKYGFSVVLWVKENRVCLDYRQDSCDSRHYPAHHSPDDFLQGVTLITNRDEALSSIPHELVAIAEGYYGEEPESEEDEEEE